MEDYSQILPPVRLIFKAILHLIARKGKGVLVTLNGFHLSFGQVVKIMMDINFKNFVKDFAEYIIIPLQISFVCSFTKKRYHLALLFYDKTLIYKCLNTNVFDRLFIVKSKVEFQVDYASIDSLIDLLRVQLYIIC